MDGADELANLQRELDVLQKLKFTPGLDGSIAGLKSKIEKLMKAAVPPPIPDQAAQLRSALLAEEDTLARIKLVTDRIDGADAKIAHWIADREALARSLTNAQQRHQEALASTATVRLAVGTQPPGAPAVPAHATLFEVFQHAIEAQLCTCEVEDKVKFEMRELAQRGLVVLLSRMATMASAAASTPK